MDWIDETAARAGRTRAVTKLFAVTSVVAFLAACAPTRVEPVQSYQGTRLARPGVVIVSDFIASPEDVRLDSGLGARLRNAMSGASAPSRQTEDERKVTTTISRVLVAEIQKLGLPAVHSNAPVAQPGQTTLVVAGQILSIDEGNRTRRNVIGLGAGASDVRARTEIYYSASGADPQRVETFEADAQSSRKPGAAETMGVGAATGRAAESMAVGVGTGLAPALAGDVDADGQRMAEAIAKQLRQFFADQGWIAASAQ